MSYSTRGISTKEPSFLEIPDSTYGLIGRPQEIIDIGECKIIAVDSITLCFSHYSLVLLTSCDTLYSIIEKSLLTHGIDSYRGIKSKVLASSMIELVLEFDKATLKIPLIHSQVSYRDSNKYDETMYFWKVKTGFLKKRIVRIVLSDFYRNGENNFLQVLEVKKIAM